MSIPTVRHYICTFMYFQARVGGGSARGNIKGVVLMYVAPEVSVRYLMMHVVRFYVEAACSP